MKSSRTGFLYGLDHQRGHLCAGLGGACLVAGSSGVERRRCYYHRHGLFAPTSEPAAWLKNLTTGSANLCKLADDLGFAPYGDPLLIVLDETFNGLDPASALKLKRHLRSRLLQYGAALLLATHSLDIVQRYADRTGVLLGGHIQLVWTASQLASLRGGQNFEEALAATIPITQMA